LLPKAVGGLTESIGKTSFSAHVRQGEGHPSRTINSDEEMKIHTFSM
jgi:hypothetical protein